MLGVGLAISSPFCVMRGGGGGGGGNDNQNLSSKHSVLLCHFGMDFGPASTHMYIQQVELDFSYRKELQKYAVLVVAPDAVMLAEACAPAVLALVPLAVMLALPAPCKRLRTRPSPPERERGKSERERNRERAATS